MSSFADAPSSLLASDAPPPATLNVKFSVTVVDKMAEAERRYTED
jgi:hypothetical protein